MGSDKARQREETEIWWGLEALKYLLLIKLDLKLNSLIKVKWHMVESNNLLKQKSPHKVYEKYDRQ